MVDLVKRSVLLGPRDSVEGELVAGSLIKRSDPCEVRFLSLTDDQFAALISFDDIKTIFTRWEFRMSRSKRVSVSALVDLTRTMKYA